MQANAQQQIEVPRSDGKTTPLMIYRPVQPPHENCAPLAVISHGAGGSEKGYRYLAEFMAGQGYTTVVMGHRESGFDALMTDVRADGIKPGVRNLVADPQAERARLLDITAALRWSESQCHAPFRVLLGHSMGAATVMLEAGAHNTIGLTAPPAAANRFDAYVALSPQGPGSVFPSQAWHAIHKPMLILTGTRDQATEGGPESRQIPWTDLPGTERHCQWLGVIDGATHMNFAGSGFGSAAVEPKVTQTIGAFLREVRRPACAEPAAIKGLTLRIK